MKKLNWLYRFILLMIYTSIILLLYIRLMDCREMGEQQIKIEQDKLEIQRKMLNSIIDVKNSIDNQECEVKLTY